LKGIDYEPDLINIVKQEHKSADYGTINPLNFVPSLGIKTNDGKTTILTQSLAIIEYLEERYPDSTPLLPPASDIAGRAHVRALASVIACDVQPVTNERILKRVAAEGGADREWAKFFMDEGFAAYEKLAAPSAGKFSYGDSITLADVCVVPAVWRAARFGVDMNQYPTMKRVFEEMSRQEAVVKAHWKNQPDCPPDVQ
jgi:maleylacetoacetate isomerase